MKIKSSKARKQRKARATAPLHVKNKGIKAPLDRIKYRSSGIKRITLRSGDTVKVVRGSRQGHEGKVAKVDVKKRKVAIEKALLMKADNKEVTLWFDPSNLVITKVDLSDPLRREKFKSLSEE
ncbi:MAG: 50S ribosomal protein L24 [Candidatus Thermoplasmatota archaeon]|nr:50S ribosomal protein L24 [Candidatus Thermoplasmatota archaeon]